MNDVLDPSHRQFLRLLLSTHPVVAFDYDGTLAPITDDPNDTRMRSTTRELLQSVCERLRCIVISGRAQSDVLRRLRGVALREVIGNHGLEPWRYGALSSLAMQEWVDELQPLAAREGVWIEDKVFSVAVHYRKAPAPQDALAAIRDRVARLSNVRVIGGKMVVNVLPANAPNKGIALIKAKERFMTKSALFVGDDETDEDVFSLPLRERVFGVRVEANADSTAPYFLSDQRAIDDFLRLLLDLAPATPQMASQE